MARMKRLKVQGVGYYHIISRTVGQEFYLGDVEKEKLMEILHYYSSLYLVKVINYCIMSNHFHLLIKSEPVAHYSDSELMPRVKRFKKRQLQGEEEIEDIKNKLADISEYVRSIKQTFSRWYNRLHDRKGYFWGDRFKSVLFEQGESLLTCCAYIDLNPVRAGIIERPEDYRWSGFSYRVSTGNKDELVSFDGIYDSDTMDQQEMLSRYRKYVYQRGAVDVSDTKASIPEKVLAQEAKHEFTLPVPVLYAKRIRYFTNGLVIGSKLFLQQTYAQFDGTVIGKKDRNVYKTGLTSTILSMRNLTFR